MFLEFAFNGTPVIFSPSAVPLLQEMIYTSSFSAFLIGFLYRFGIGVQQMQYPLEDK